MSVLSGPTAFAATANAVGGVVLTWTNVTGNMGYTLLRSTVSGDYSTPVTATVATNVVTYTASTGLTLGTPYYFVAKTSNANGLGPNSSQATATPRTVPSTMLAPTLSAGNVNISVGFVPPESNGSAIITYSIQRATVSAMTTGLTTVATLSNPFPSTGLVNGTQYFYRIAASNAAGLGTYSAISSNTPAAVPNIVVFSGSNAGVASVSLAWTVPTNNGAAITSYDLRVSTDSSSGPFTSLSSGLLVSPFVATGLTNGSLYFFQMAASNVMGFGPYSLTASNTPRTVPDPITDLSANPSGVSTSLILSWVAPWNGGNAITGYRWFRSSNADMSGVLTSNATLVATLSTTVTALVAGVMSYFQIVASNVAGFSASSAVISNYPRAAPSAVGTVTTTALNSSVSLSWLATTASNGDAITAYKSQYSLSSGAAAPWTDISVSPDISAVATGLTNGSLYFFRVSASNVAGYGPNSAVVSRTPFTVPDKVTVFTATPANAANVLNWSAPFNGGSAIGGYAFFRSSNANMMPIDTSLALGAVLTVTDNRTPTMVNGNTYYYYIRACNAAGYGVSSEIVSVVPRTVPGQPTVTYIVSNQQITLSWAAPLSNGAAITSYNISYSTTASVGPWTSLSSGMLVSPYVATGLTNGSSYYFTLAASNAAGYGTGSTTSGPHVPRTTPSAPASLTVTPSGNLCNVVQWTAPSNNGGCNILGYRWLRSKIEDMSVIDLSGVTTSSTLLHTNGSLTYGLTYYYQVQACNVAGYGALTSTVSGTPFTLPGAPSNHVAYSVNQSTINVSFSAPASDGGSAITSYIVTPYVNAIARSTFSGATSPVAVTVSTGFSYTFRVQARNAAGIGSATTTATAATYSPLDPVSVPSGATKSYLSNAPYGNTKVTYTDVASTEAQIAQNGNASWSISYGGSVDTLNWVSKITFTDGNVFLVDPSLLGSNVISTLMSYSINHALIGPGTYMESASPNINKSFRLEGTTVSGAIMRGKFGSIAIAGSDIYLKNLTVDTTGQNDSPYYYFAIATILSYSNQYSNIVLDTVNCVNPYMLQGTLSYESYRGVAFNTISGLTIRNCVFPKTQSASALFQSVQNCVVTGTTFNCGSWGDVIIAATNTSSISSYYPCSNIDFSDSGNLFADPDPGIVTSHTAPIIVMKPNEGSMGPIPITYGFSSSSTVKLPSDFHYVYIVDNCLNPSLPSTVSYIGGIYGTAYSYVATKNRYSNEDLFISVIATSLSDQYGVSSSSVYAYGRDLNNNNFLLDDADGFSAASWVGPSSSWTIPDITSNSTIEVESASLLSGFGVNLGNDIAFYSDDIGAYNVLSTNLSASLSNAPPGSLFRIESNAVVAGQTATLVRASETVEYTLSLAVLASPVVRTQVWYASTSGDYASLLTASEMLPALSSVPSFVNSDVTVDVTNALLGVTYPISLDGGSPINMVNGSYTFSGSELTEGQHSASVRGTNGNVFSDYSNISFTYDISPPAIIFLNVGAPDLTGNVSVNFDVSDGAGAGVASYTVYVNDVSHADNPPPPINIQLPEGVYDTYTIKVIATDTLGNTISSSVSVVYAPTPGQAQDIPVNPAADTIPINVGGTIEVVPIVTTTTVATEVISPTTPDGGYLFVKDPATDIGSAALVAKTGIGPKANQAVDDNIKTIIILREGADEEEIVTIASVGTSAAPVTNSKTINGQSVSGTVDTSTAASGNTVIFGIQNSIPTPPQLDVYFKYVDPVGDFIPDGFEIYMEFEAPQFSRMKKVGINRSDDNQQTYSFDGYAYKKAGTVSTFSFTFVRNSDYRIAMAYGSGIGDPYIMTVGGNLYKIPPFNGPMRLYQGAVGNQLLTVNATTRIDDDKAAMDGDTNAVIQTLTKPTGPHNFNMTDAMSFFEKIYISYGGKSMTVNVYNNEFRVEGRETWEVKNAGRVQKVGETFDFYSNLSARNYEISPCPGVTVRIGIIPIRNVRSSVDIFAPNMEGGNGAFVHRLSRKAMTLRKLNSETPVERRDCPVKRTLGEVFVCNEFTKEKQIPFVG